MAHSDSNRPLSPHATIYRWPLNAIMSIFHRLTGVGLLVGLIVIVWLFTAAASSASYFGLVSNLLNSIVGDLVLMACLAAFWFHFFNGIRHLFWDAGLTFEEGNIRLSAYLGLAGTAIMTLGSLLYVWI